MIRQRINQLKLAVLLGALALMLMLVAGGCGDKDRPKPPAVAGGGAAAQNEQVQQMVTELRKAAKDEWEQKYLDSVLASLVSQDKNIRYANEDYAKAIDGWNVAKTALAVEVNQHAADVKAVKESATYRWGWWTIRILLGLLVLGTVCEVVLKFNVTGKVLTIAKTGYRVGIGGIGGIIMFFVSMVWNGFRKKGSK